jgi:membrane-associated phospholipid phosphatase
MTDKLTRKFNDIFVANLRAFPCTLSVYSIVGGLIFNNPTYLFFGIYIFLCDGVGAVLKLLTKQLYKVLNRDTIPLLGTGRRPDGAKYCSAFLTESNLEGVSGSYGMPSGHAIVAGVTFTFWLNYIKEHTQDPKLRRRQYVLLGLICSAVVISRFYLGCHTFQQAIIGALIGSGLGVVGYKYLYKQILYYIDYYNLLNF